MGMEESKPDIEGSCDGPPGGEGGGQSGQGAGALYQHGNRAPACHLHFDDKFEGDIIMQDVQVPEHGLTLFTYYCVMQFNCGKGKDGGGYAGIQEHPNGREFHFSLWDPVSSNDPIEVHTKHEKTTTRRFTHEGKGLVSKNFHIGWKPDLWQTLVVRRWDHGKYTLFGFWLFTPDTNKWVHMITMRYPVPNVYFHTPTTSFIEDWKNTGEKYRRIHLRNGYKRKRDQTWAPFHKAKFNVCKGANSVKYHENYDGGKHEDAFFMQTGHGTTPCPELAKCRDVHVPTAAKQEPPQPPIDFKIDNVTPEKISWSVPESSTPQFAYRVLVDDVKIASAVAPDVRFLSVCTSGEVIEIILEDVLGRETSRKFNRSSQCPTNATDAPQ